MDLTKMLTNAAVASHAHKLLHSNVRGAVLRSLFVWLNSRTDYTAEQLAEEVQDHKEFNL